MGLHPELEVCVICVSRSRKVGSDLRSSTSCQHFTSILLLIDEGALDIVFEGFLVNYGRQHSRSRSWPKCRADLAPLDYKDAASVLCAQSMDLNGVFNILLSVFIMIPKLGNYASGAVVVTK